MWQKAFKCDVTWRYNTLVSSDTVFIRLFLDLIKRSENGRIVNVASLQAIFTLDLTSKKLGTFPGVWSEYKYTKLCNILFTQELAKRLEGSKITTYSLNPGLVVTDIYKYIPEPISTIIKILKQIYFKVWYTKKKILTMAIVFFYFRLLEKEPKLPFIVL